MVGIGEIGLRLDGVGRGSMSKSESQRESEREREGWGGKRERARESCVTEGYFLVRGISNLAGEQGLREKEGVRPTLPSAS